LFYIVGSALAVIGLVLSWQALTQGHYQPLGLLVSIYIEGWVLTGAVWMGIENKRWRKREEEKQREEERNEYR
jgi:hypothetical protein